MRAFCSWFAVIAVLGVGGSEGRGQYDEPDRYEPIRARFAHLGFLNVEFEPRKTNPLADSGGIVYSRPMPALGFRQGGVDLVLGYTTYRLRNERREAVWFGASFTHETVITGNRSSALVFPLVVATDFTKSEALGRHRETFNVVSVGIGGGIKYRYASSAADISLQAVEIAHYCFEGLSTGNGFSAATVAEALVLLTEAPVFEGLALGYRFRLQVWSMSREKFDYRSLSHGPYVGILL